MWLMLLFVIFVSVGCLNGQGSETSTEEKKRKNGAGSETAIVRLPIPVGDEVFNRAYGWIDKYTILYSTNGVQGENVYAYNVKKGTNRHITTSQSAIISMEISNSGEYIFMRSASGPSSSLITIMKKDGTIEFTHVLDAFDLTMEWNPYNEQEIFLAVFSEDWQEKTYFLSLADHKITAASSIDPFSKWYSPKQFVYLDWIGENAAVSADLILKDLNTKQEEKLLSGVSHTDTFKDVLMTVTDNPDDTEQAVYTFYGENLKELGSFVTPQELGFSSRLVPEYDYLADEKAFFFFQPVMKNKSGHDEKFQLMEYDVEKNKLSMVMGGLKNEPLSCSRDGRFCLYGFQFEKLIDLKEKTIMKLSS